MQIVEYTDSYQQQVIKLIVTIQQDELGVKITADDQPDLGNVKEFYQRDRGNFWIAIPDNEDRVIGTIALVDIGNRETALRKMFVDPDYRGKEKKVAQGLLDTLFDWCRKKKVDAIYLGTINIMKAAHRFYEKNGFQKVEKYELPANFPVMKVDNVFYKFSFTDT